MAIVPFRPDDPQSLIGEWSGQATDPGNGSERWSGTIVLTVTRVEGDRVFGTFEFWCGGGVSCKGARTYHAPQPVQGTLRGNELKIERLDVVVDGLYMTGRRASQVWLGYARLTKRTSGTPQPASGTPAPPGAAGSNDGVYAGDVCLGPSPNGNPARCFLAKATVRDGKIIGEWPTREGVTVTLAGEVSTMGDVKIQWHARRPDGSQFSRANLAGTIRNGRLDANGAFPNGRTVSVRWTLNGPAKDSSEKEPDGSQHAHPSGVKRK
ncbi:MAG TPA: hypothetical protein VJX92_20095 [Methylomirabilota bacterium]|nr:hypothetical protein [Methylomirabilota bacterium]